MGRPRVHARPRAGDRRLGALGQRLVPAHRGGRLRLDRARGGGLLPRVSRRRGRARARARRALRTAGIAGLARGAASARSSCSTASPRAGSEPTARAARSSTSRCSRWRSSSRPCTARRSSCCSRSPRSWPPSADASSARACSTGLALLTRPAGFALLPALALLAWRSPRPGARARLAGVAPGAVRALPALPVARGRRPLAFMRRTGDLDAAPLAGRARSAGSGTGCAPAGPESASSPRAPTRTSTGAQSRTATPTASPRSTSQGLAFLVLFLALTVVAWRRFGAPYGLFCAASLAIPLSVPSERWPLLSLPRFGLVVFPFFLALAWLGRNERVHVRSSRSARCSSASRWHSGPCGSGWRRARATRGGSTWWWLLVGVLALLAYSSRATGGGRRRTRSTSGARPSSAVIVYAVVLGLVLLIARGGGRCASCSPSGRRLVGRALGWAFAIFVLVLIVGAALDPFLDAGEEQGLTPSGWDSEPRGRVRRERDRRRRRRAGGRGAHLPRPRLQPAPAYGVASAIVGVGVAFGLAHGLIEALLILVAVRNGLAFLRERTDSVYPPILLHAAFNGFALRRLGSDLAGRLRRRPLRRRTRRARRRRGTCGTRRRSPPR